jgi:signal transduction histidine kinase
MIPRGARQSFRRRDSWHEAAADNHLPLLADVAGWALIEVDAGGRVVRANDLVEQVTGYHPQELVGRHLSCLGPAPDTAGDQPPAATGDEAPPSGRHLEAHGVAHLLEHALAHGIHQVECWQARRDGSRFWASCVVLAHPQDGQMAGFSVVIQDRTAPRNHLAQLRAVADVNNAVRDGVSRDVVLGMIARRVRELLGASACLVMTLEAGENLLVRAADGAAVQELLGTCVSADDTIEGEAVHSQQPLTVSDLADEQRRQTSPLGAIGLQSLLLVPVPGWRRPGGLIQVADSQRRRFTDEDLRTVGLFAAQVGMHVEHDRAYAELQQLATIAAPDAKPLQQTLAALTYCVVDDTRATACAVYLLNNDQSLRLTASYGPADFLPVGVRSPGVPDAARAAVASKSLIVHEGLPLDVRGGRPRRARGLTGRSSRGTTLVCVPLMARGSVLGVLCNYCSTSAHPSKLELAYFSLIAGQAAAAVDSATLSATAMEKAALEERARLARELHDSVSPALYGIDLAARTARQLLGHAPEQADQPIDYILQLAEGGLAEMRALLFEMRPEALSEEGLVAALTKQVTALHSRHGLATDAELGPEPTASLEVKRTLFRIAQEALQNVTRHARASTVTVRLRTTPTDLVLAISDDGVGFDTNTSFPGHLGLRSMRERTAEIGGVLDITSTPGEGTTVTARGPLELQR